MVRPFLFFLVPPYLVYLPAVRVVLELPDLGAFTTVFRALPDLQPPRNFAIPIPLAVPNPGSSEADTLSSVSIAHARTNSLTNTQSEGDSIIAAYLTRHSKHNPDTDDDGLNASASASEEYDDDADADHDYISISGSGSGSGSDTETEPEGRPVEIEGVSDVDSVGVVHTRAYTHPHGGGGHQPSLGYLDEALSFIASERARYAAQRDRGENSNSNSYTPWTQGRGQVEPRRGRRRRRVRSKATPTESTTEGGEEYDDEYDEEGEEEDSPFSSSSLDFRPSHPRARRAPYKSTPGTPRRRISTATRAKSKDKRRPHHHRRRTPSLLHLRHTKSTPSLSLPLPPSSTSTHTTRTIVPALDPRVLQLRSLTHKLRLLFPEDSAALGGVLSHVGGAGGGDGGQGGFIDPRGPGPREGEDTLIHVFIDQ